MHGPIRKSLKVPLDPNAAFDVFTNGIDHWWPKESHSLSGQQEARVVLEPRKDGRLYEITPDGKEAEWGTVTDWTPGARLGISWYVGTPQDEATQVEVTFTKVDTGTQVDLTHSGWEIKGDLATSAKTRYSEGWDIVLCACFSGACQELTTA